MNSHLANKQKIGLALGSGSARGLAHIGVMHALEEAGIKIDCSGYQFWLPDRIRVRVG